MMWGQKWAESQSCFVSVVCWSHSSKPKETWERERGRDRKRGANRYDILPVVFLRLSPSDIIGSRGGQSAAAPGAFGMDSQTHSRVALKTLGDDYNKVWFNQKAVNYNWFILQKHYCLCSNIHQLNCIVSCKFSLQGVLDFRKGEARCILRAHRVDEQSSRQENQSNHHLLQTETSSTRRPSLLLWPPWQPSLWWG